LSRSVRVGARLVKIGAVVLAAGMARRMGTMKVLLAWQDGQTILEQVIAQLQVAAVDPVIVVTGNRASEVSVLARAQGATAVLNPDYERGEMLSSLKVGLQAMPEAVEAALVVLGDQPRIQAQMIVEIVVAYAEGRGRIVAPSFAMRRGHPLLIDRSLWAELAALPTMGAPRDVINRHADEIAYVLAADDSVLSDVDTPEQYAAERAKAGLPPA